MNVFDTIIVSGGNIEEEFALHFFENRDAAGKCRDCKVIAADKGLEFLIRQGIRPDMVIGDFDSASASVEDYLKEHKEIQVYRLKPEKDDTDTQSALRLAAQEGAASVLLLGCTGTRMDHVLANIGLLLFGKILGLQVTICDPWNRIRLVSSGTELRKEETFGTYVSFFALGGDVMGLTLEGFYYPLKDHHLSMAEAGLTVSNEIVEKTAKVTYKSGELLMIESRDGANGTL